MAHQSSFSSKQNNFAVFNAGGIVNIWDCRIEKSHKLISSTVLPHHLQASCTCFEWCPLSSQKTLGGDLIVYGSSSGSIYAFSPANSAVASLPDNGHTGSVSSIAWHPHNGSIYTAADDGFLIEWSVEKKKLVRRWRCPHGDTRSRGGYTALSVPLDNFVVAGRHQIDVWDLEVGRVINTYIGHSSDIIRLAPVSMKFENESQNCSYVLSIAKSDRVMYAWRVGKNPDSSPSAAFLLPSAPIEARAYFNTKIQKVNVYVVLDNGSVAVYSQVLNGKKMLEPIRCVSSIEIVDSVSNKRVPVVDVSSLSGEDKLSIAYGSVTQPYFELLDMNLCWEEKQVKLHRDLTEVKSDNLVTVSKTTSPSKFHVANAIAPSVSLNKRTLAEVLQENSAKPLQASSVLAQGLLSGDKRILDSVLGSPSADVIARKKSMDEDHIEKAIGSLDNALLLALLEELTSRLANSQPAASQIAAKWLSVLLRSRGSRLATFNSSSGTSANGTVSSKLAHLRETLVNRTMESARVLQLRGRLRMLRGMSSKMNVESKKTEAEIKMNPVRIETPSPRLPFVLKSADATSSEESESEEEAAGFGGKQKRLKRDKKEESSKGDADVSDSESSVLELASDHDFSEGEREDRLNDDSEGENADDGNNFDMVMDEVESGEEISKGKKKKRVKPEDESPPAINSKSKKKNKKKLHA